MKTSQAGTLESMDCLVTLTEAPSGAGIKIEITGASAARFKSAMEKKITDTLCELGKSESRTTEPSTSSSARESKRPTKDCKRRVLNK